MPFGLFANLVEFPAVAKGNARFQMQVMAKHTREDADRAAEIIYRSMQHEQIVDIHPVEDAGVLELAY